MAYVIGAGCVDVTDRACLDVCPVDCIYVGDRKSYINAAECIDCGACEPECPVDAIFADRKARSDESKAVFVADSIAFFEQALPGRDAPLGNPGGAAAVGEVGVDTPMVSAL
ncbi:4Fe-4S binding protein [Saccharopolyspora erythraea]|uniref:indolepyruvate ferredoxin oxidoreductase subunit alpha n=1 Tax=Saccharopolyspora erythraea TaxID=1836 RepID=UPI001BAB21D3|nr:ferredoxin family protein [Saccharopolyspora erythraea]QUH02042.1 4Fe-4S binding protein [Saccharopolyspora erythraea]